MKTILANTVQFTSILLLLTAIAAYIIRGKLKPTLKSARVLRDVKILSRIIFNGIFRYRDSYRTMVRKLEVFYLFNLLMRHYKISEKIEVDLHLTQHLLSKKSNFFDKTVLGLCVPKGQDSDGNIVKFDVYVDPVATEWTLCRSTRFICFYTLCHEMVHVQQMVSGQMGATYVDVGEEFEKCAVVWNGKTFHQWEMKYEDMPWEQDAHRMGEITNWKFMYRYKNDKASLRQLLKLIYGDLRGDFV